MQGLVRNAMNLFDNESDQSSNSSEKIGSDNEPNQFVNPGEKIRSDTACRISLGLTGENVIFVAIGCFILSGLLLFIVIVNCCTRRVRRKKSKNTAPLLEITQ